LNKKFWGDLYQPIGFFPPEMAIDDKVLKIIKEFGFKWVSVPEISYGSQPAVPNKFYKDKNSGINVLFRNKRISVMMLSATVRDAESMIEVTKDLHDSDQYWFTVMDAETFGHHRIGHQKFLLDLFDSEFFQSMTANEMLNLNLPIPEDEVELRPCTWSNQEQDFWLDKEQTQHTTDKSFILWKDPSNPIHSLQWELTKLVIDNVNDYSDKDSDQWKKAREALDSAIASDQFWWASAKPWWSLEMVEQGAYDLKEVLKILDENSASYSRAGELYRSILDQAFEWQRSGYIRQKHLEASGTYLGEPFKDRAPVNWYNEVVLAMEDEMMKAAAKQDYENALKWRDALYKLNTGTDIYDVLHAVDDFWQSRNMPWGFTGVKPFFDHEWGEFSEFIINHFKDFDTKEKFDEGKKKFLEEFQSLYATDVWTEDESSDGRKKSSD